MSYLFAGVVMVLVHRKILSIHEIFHHQEQKCLITTNRMSVAIGLFHSYCYLIVTLNFFKKASNTDHWYSFHCTSSFHGALPASDPKIKNIKEVKLIGSCFHQRRHKDSSPQGLVICNPKIYLIACFIDSWCLGHWKSFTAFRK